MICYASSVNHSGQGHQEIKPKTNRIQRNEYEGGGKFPGKLASFFDFAESASKGGHSHYKYYEDNPYIAEDSNPLVVSLNKIGICKTTSDKR